MLLRNLVCWIRTKSSSIDIFVEVEVNQGFNNLKLKPFKVNLVNL